MNGNEDFQKFFYSKIESSVAQCILGLLPPIVFQDEEVNVNGLRWTVFNRLNNHFKRIVKVADDFNSMAGDYKAVFKIRGYRKAENDNVPIRWGDVSHYLHEIKRDIKKLTEADLRLEIRDNILQLSLENRITYLNEWIGLIDRVYFYSKGAFENQLKNIEKLSGTFIDEETFKHFYVALLFVLAPYDDIARIIIELLSKDVAYKKYPDLMTIRWEPSYESGSFDDYIEYLKHSDYQPLPSPTEKDLLPPPVSNLPVLFIVPEVRQTLYDALKPYVNEEERPALLALLVDSETPATLINYHCKQNSFAYVFHVLYKDNKITNLPKDIANWICANFSPANYDTIYDIVRGKSGTAPTKSKRIPINP
ncbi:hypothetical protein [Fibrella arboris]|uniref:hypothetical protein n=1 Tax=Fibrella arboris TaxID=3242486 RepID=UPI00351FC239